MQSISIHSRVGSDGKLRIEVPLDLADRDVEVVIVVQPVETPSPSEKQDGWGEDFFSRIVGGWQGEPLVRGELLRRSAV